MADTVGVGRRHQIRRLLSRFELTPFRGALLYVVLGMAALYVSDVLFARYFSEPLLSQLQAAKGAAEVLLTGAIVFVLMTGSRYPLKLKADRLDRQRAQLEVLHRVIRHNLRNDLNVISGYAALLRDRVDPERHDDWCAQILAGAQSVLHYTEQADRIQRISADEGRRHRPFDLTETIRDVLQNHPQVTDSVRVETDPSGEAVVEANYMLEAALRELVTNAIVHNDADRPRVSITVDPTGGPSAAPRLIVEDNGPGVNPEIISVLERAREDQLRHLDGLGLWLVDWTVMASDGDLAIETPGDRGTRVTLTLPDAVPGRSTVAAVG